MLHITGKISIPAKEKLDSAESKMVQGELSLEGSIFIEDVEGAGSGKYGR